MSKAFDYLMKYWKLGKQYVEDEHEKGNYSKIDLAPYTHKKWLYIVPYLAMLSDTPYGVLGAVEDIPFEHEGHRYIKNLTEKAYFAAATESKVLKTSMHFPISYPTYMFYKLYSGFIRELIRIPVYLPKLPNGFEVLSVIVKSQAETMIFNKIPGELIRSGIYKPQAALTTSETQTSTPQNSESKTQTGKSQTQTSTPENATSETQTDGLENSTDREILRRFAYTNKWLISTRIERDKFTAGTPEWRAINNVIGEKVNQNNKFLADIEKDLFGEIIIPETIIMEKEKIVEKEKIIEKEKETIIEKKNIYPQNP